MASLESGEGIPLLRVGGLWFAATVGAGRADVPGGVLTTVLDGHAAHQRVRVGDELMVAVGTPISAIDAAYFEFVPLADVETTLSAVRRSLALGALVASLLGGALGALASRTVLRPLRDVAGAASVVMGGDLTARVESRGDPDLDPLLASFNDMVDELRGRVERDARFASNVAHELRGPLATLAAAGDHAKRHAEDPAEVRRSLDILSGTIRDFSGLVLDLLDISRMEAGEASLNLEVVEVRSFVAAVVGARDLHIDIDPALPAVVTIDKRRIAQCLTNLLQNADRYAGGPTALAVTAAGRGLRFTVDDDGPGIPEDERSYIFERFARGAAADDVEGGTGLGLALVREHMRLHHGDVQVGASPNGGSRFTLQLPLEDAG